MGKPQDLPAGESQMMVGITLNFITYVVALLMLYGVGRAVVHAAVDMGLTGLFLYLALMITSKLSRFQQAFGALCGAGAVLNAAAILMIFPLMGSSTSAIGEFAYFLLLVWGLSLSAHVVRHTFGIHMVSSIGVALLYFLFVSSLLTAIFPPEVVPAESVSWLNNTVSFLV